MLIYLAGWLEEFHSGFRVFQYITLRAMHGVFAVLEFFFIGLIGMATLKIR